MSSRGRVSPTITENPIRPLQDIDKAHMAILPPTALVPGVQARPPPLRPLAIPNRPPQVSQQPVARSEVWITTHNPGCAFKVRCLIDARGRIFGAAGLMGAGIEELPELELVVFRDVGEEELLVESSLVAVVPDHALVGPLAYRRIELVR